MVGHIPLEDVIMVRVHVSQPQSAQYRDDHLALWDLELFPNEF